MWPDNSQGFSLEMSGQSKGSQHTSQEVNISVLNYGFVLTVTSEHALFYFIQNDDCILHIFVLLIQKF